MRLATMTDTEIIMAVTVMGTAMAEVTTTIPSQSSSSSNPEDSTSYRATRSHPGSQADYSQTLNPHKLFYPMIITQFI